MCLCKECVYVDLCYMVEHYGRDLEDDFECKRFKDNNEFVRVKHGMWIKDGNKRTCPHCGFYYHSNGVDYNYCFNCGAKMDGGKAK